jgi:uncharacterized protein YqfA (UPF0365 family)
MWLLLIIFVLLFSINTVTKIYPIISAISCAGCVETAGLITMRPRIKMSSITVSIPIVVVRSKTSLNNKVFESRELAQYRIEKIVEKISESVEDVISLMLPLYKEHVNLNRIWYNYISDVRIKFYSDS